MFKCRCCSNNISEKLFSTKLLKKNVDFFECSNCKYVQTESPTWLDEAYNSTIHTHDTGILMRNKSNISFVLATLHLIGKKNSSIVDYAGGYGLLVRSLRDLGIDAFWADPYCENLTARGFEYTNKMKASLVTAFEAFEHFEKPTEEMTNLLKVAPNILLTTNIIPNPAPNPEDWWYYGVDHGQHIGFYRLKTFKYLADKFGLHFMSDGASRHFFSKKKFSYKYWILLVRLAKFFPKLFCISMKSKTWDDHIVMEKKSKE